MRKPRKLTPAQKKLQADFDKMMQSHDRPLERGAKAKGVARSTDSTRDLKGTPMFERNRLNKEASVDSGAYSTAAKPTTQYTGDKVLGVALLHKSNYAPVFNAEAAIDIAKMRRG